VGGGSTANIEEVESETGVLTTNKPSQTLSSSSSSSSSFSSSSRPLFSG